MFKSINTHLTDCFAFKSRAGFYTTLPTARKLCGSATLNAVPSPVLVKPCERFQIGLFIRRRIFQVLAKFSHSVSLEQLAKGLSNSTIIGDNQTYLVMLSRWLRPVAQTNGSWILCWRASFHGWAASTFHSLCDNKGPTVTIVKDTNNNTFGGYTSIPWRK